MERARTGVRISVISLLLLSATDPYRATLPARFVTPPALEAPRSLIRLTEPSFASSVASEEFFRYRARATRVGGKIIILSRTSGVRGTSMVAINWPLLISANWIIDPSLSFFRLVTTRRESYVACKTNFSSHHNEFLVENCVSHTNRENLFIFFISFLFASLHLFFLVGQVNSIKRSMMKGDLNMSATSGMSAEIPRVSKYEKMYVSTERACTDIT